MKYAVAEDIGYLQSDVIFTRPHKQVQASSSKPQSNEAHAEVPKTAVHRVATQQSL